MLRRLSQFLTAISFISFLAITAFWLRSYWKTEHLPFTWKQQSWELSSVEGKFSVDSQPEIVKLQAAMLMESRELGILIDAKERQALESERIVQALVPTATSDTAESKHYYISVVPNDGQPTRELRIDPEATKTALQAAEENAARIHAEVPILQSKFNSLIAAISSLHARSIMLPPPLFAIATLILPTLAYRRRLIRRVREKAGLCGFCGYDLRATPDRCPECGRIKSTLHDRL
jgi:hypothetical protein